jgi:enoyl-CoA hydratase
MVNALGRQRALALLLDAGALTAGEALQVGMVLDVVDDPVEAALEVAERYAAMDPDLVRDIKRAVGIAAKGDFDETLEFESWAQAASAKKPQLAEAIAQFSTR